ncbi:MAG TPA: energy transducer TonB [Allosphingosinicella sp.]|nr:energy transducer TonB [Allosphingosinicella sp.]
MDPRRDPRLTVHEPRSPLRRLRAWAEGVGWERLLAFLVAAILAAASLALDWFDEPDADWELGLVAISDDGELLFTEWPDVRENYRVWVREGRRRDEAHCLAIPPRQRERLLAEAAGKSVLAFTGVELGGPAEAEGCGGRGSRTAEIDFDTLSWVPCGVDTFVANRFACPGRRPSRVTSEPPLEGWEYYPRDALHAEQEGAVSVRVTRDASGTPTGCTVAASSGHAVLDRQTCRLVGTDPLFTRDEMEAPERIAEPIEQTIRWQLEEER